MPLLYRVATDQDAKPMPSKDHVSRGLWRATGGGMCQVLTVDMDQCNDRWSARQAAAR